MSVKQSLLFYSLAALAVAGTASAQDRDQTFRDRDRNNDGVLTQGEYGGHPGNFRALDVDGDGVLSYQEFVRRHTGDTASFADPFTVMDRNRDGYLTIREYTGRDVLFRRMDRNDDGRLTRAEFNNEDETREDTLVRRRFRTLDRNDDARLTRNEAQLNGTEFRTADANRNGWLSMAEFVVWNDRTAAGIGSFDNMDRNNDGVVSWGEWRSERRDVATFDRLDRNDDRVLNRAEFNSQAVGYYGGSLEDFRARDRNDDGVLSRGESGMSGGDFDRADDDNDGVLTLKEYRQFSEYDGRSGGGFLGSILGRVEDVRFSEMDANDDGVLRPSEWRGSMGEFDRLDTNNDRVITLFEYTR
jgi:Ca2+-binding EF-hand superfamily protein